MTGEEVLSELEIFRRAVALSPPERAAFLNQACGVDLPLRREVESLLDAHDPSSSFLEQPALLRSDHADVEVPGMVIGPYKLLEQIGEGGFGVVYLTEQTRPVRRQVALKIIKPGMD